MYMVHTHLNNVCFCHFIIWVCQQHYIHLYMVLLLSLSVFITIPSFLLTSSSQHMYYVSSVGFTLSTRNTCTRMFVHMVYIQIGVAGIWGNIPLNSWDWLIWVYLLMIQKFINNEMRKLAPETIIRKHILDYWRCTIYNNKKNNI